MSNATVLVFAITSDATDRDWTQVHQAIASFGGQVVTSQTSKPTSEPTAAVVPTDRMAKARAAKAAKAAARKAAEQGEQSPAPATDRMAMLAAAKGEPQPTSKPTTRRSRSASPESRWGNFHQVDLSDKAYEALIATLGNLVAPNKKSALTSFLEGLCPFADLAKVPTKGGESTFAHDMWAKVERADKA